MYHFGFIIEQALGHITHGKNLQTAVPRDPQVAAEWGLIPWEATGWAAHLPLYKSNWTLRSGLRARRALAQFHQHGPLDAVLFHTQVTATLSQDWLERIPAVLSLDATPLQYDRLGAYYGHTSGPRWLENLKWRLSRDCYRKARHLVTWSEWARQGLIDEYGVPPEKITVIPPGVNIELWKRPTPLPLDNTVVRVLFVGGNMERKGGLLLLEAFHRLRREGLPVELHLATRDAVTPEEGLVVYDNMRPNSPELIDLYHHCDIFCLPTYGDCLPMVLSEAAAASLPMISTQVAGIPEVVCDGVTGLLIAPGDVDALTDRLRQLVTQPHLRARMGAAAESMAHQKLNAEQNAFRLLDLMKGVADQQRSEATEAFRSPTIEQDQPGLLDSPSKQEHSTAGRAPKQTRNDILLTVSGTIPADIHQQIAGGIRPETDYLALARGLPADIIDYAAARQSGGAIGRLLERLGGPNLALAWACFRLRGRYRAILSDGEQIGLPLALMLKIAGGKKRPKHHMIVHILSVAKKMLFLDVLRAQDQIDTFLTYSSWQQQFIQKRWNLPPERVVFTPFMVNSGFFQPSGEVQPNPYREQFGAPMICAVGLEFRDYPTLIEAVRGLDVQVVIAAASPWSKRADSSTGRELPPNVTVARFRQHELRQIYAASRFMVMPLFKVNFQAGVTAILEAMAMEKAVICSHTPGQTDVIIEGETGLYVPPGDPLALRGAIQYLINSPRVANQMGQNGRRRVLDSMSLDCYVERLGKYIR